jgi:serine protease
MPSHSGRRFAAVSGVLLLAWAVAQGAIAAQVSTVRVMLHPYLAAPGTLPPDALTKLETLAGTSLTLSGTTRTGALDLALPEPIGEAAAAQLMHQLRVDRGVLWAQPQFEAPAKKSLAQKVGVPGRRLMMRLKDGVEPEWGALLARLSASAGVPVKAERQIGDIWVLSVAEKQSPEVLSRIADLVQQDPDVQFADPVKRVMPQAAPNDPFYSRQWSLHGEVAGINIEPAWALQPGAAGVTVAVIDTGILPHPDLVGRVLPGYDFISDPESARDGNARDPDPRDEGDWSNGECNGATYDSFFHGLFVAGQIAANTDNGIGIAGVAPGVNILPVRTLGRCGGTFEDVLEGMLWASGVRIAGVPANKTPAKILNLSLGGFGTCDQAIQQAIDDALAHGAVVVVAAGNETSDVAEFAPANCGGVITVGAHNTAGSITSYSNFGRGVTISAPGGDLPVDDLILSLGNDGTTVPGNPAYYYGAGTSFSAPLVSGTAAMMLARDAMLTAGRLQELLTGTTRNFPPGSACTAQNLCGAGMLDAGAVIASTIPGGPPPPNTFPVVEYYRADLDHYFITASPIEAHYVDTFLRGIFQRTGLYFYAYLNTFLAPPGVKPVCRFYASADVQINSHYYTGDPNECSFVQSRWVGIWDLEQPDAFYIQVPDFNGNCPAGTLPVYRFFNNRRDANHRYTVDLSVRRAMINRAWAPEGNGPNNVVFCSPI